MKPETRVRLQVWGASAKQRSLGADIIVPGAANECTLGNSPMKHFDGQISRLRVASSTERRQFHGVQMDEGNGSSQRRLFESLHPGFLRLN